MKVSFVLFLVLLASLLAGCNAATPDLSAHATQVAFIVYATETAMAPTPTATQPQPTATATLAPPSPTPTHQASTPTSAAPTSTSAPQDSTPTPFAIQGEPFAVDYAGECETDVQIKNVVGDGLDVSGEISIRNGQWTLWCYGARHTWLGTLDYGGYNFASSATDPLQFLVTRDQGYLFVDGQGAVTLPDGNVVALPPANLPVAAATPVPVPATAAAVEATPVSEMAAPGRIRLSAGRYGKPLWLEVLAGDFKLVSGDTLLAGSAIGVQEDWYNSIPPGWLVEIGDGDIVVQGAARAPGTRLIADASGRLIASSTPSSATASAPKTTPDAPATLSLTVKAPTLNVRSGPGSAYPISDSVRQGAHLIVTGQHNGCAWLKVTLGAAEAWISGSPEYVALNVPCKSVPVAPAPPLPAVAAAPATKTPVRASNVATATGGMASVPAGEFIMGTAPWDLDYALNVCASEGCDGVNVREELADEMPQRTVSVAAFFIDKLEVTNGQYQECVAAGKCAPLQTSPSTARANYAVEGVAWDQAGTYCAWRGKRLPSEMEWEKAGRGTDGRLYPWGNNWDISRIAASPSPVGQHPEGASPYGVLDMIGSASEWVADKYDVDYATVKGSICARLWSGWTTRVAMRCPPTGYIVSPPPIGFRCARSAP
jgi:formylglycine-generating enzyme required for sulfatase activity